MIYTLTLIIKPTEDIYFLRKPPLLTLTWNYHSIVNQLCERETVSRSVVSNSATPWTVAQQVLYPWNSPGKNSEVGCHALLQGIFLTQGSKSFLLHLLHGEAGSLPLVPPEKHRGLNLSTWKHWNSYPLSVGPEVSLIPYTPPPKDLCMLLPPHPFCSPIHAPCSWCPQLFWFPSVPLPMYESMPSSGSVVVSLHHHSQD